MRMGQLVVSIGWCLGARFSLACLLTRWDIICPTRCPPLRIQIWFVLCFLYGFVFGCTVCFGVSFLLHLVYFLRWFVHLGSPLFVFFYFYR